MATTKIAHIRVTATRKRKPDGYSCSTLVTHLDSEVRYRVRGEIVRGWPSDAINDGLVFAEDLAARNGMMFVKTHANAGDIVQEVNHDRR